MQRSDQLLDSFRIKFNNYVIEFFNHEALSDEVNSLSDEVNSSLRFFLNLLIQKTL